MSELVELTDGGTLLIDKDFVSKSLSDNLFDKFKKHIPWNQEMGRYAIFPRLTAYYADDGLNYTYSGVTHQGTGWPRYLELLKEKVDAASGVIFNSLLFNYYRNGKDSIGWHTDGEKELGQNPVVASLTFGATRDFKLKHKNGSKVGKMTIPLTHGTLLVMGGTIQHHWLHAVLKTEEDVGERINLTFRKMV